MKFSTSLMVVDEPRLDRWPKDIGCQAASKDINAVIDAQRDLVAVVARLQTLVCIKG